MSQQKTLRSLQKSFHSGVPITVVTAYDATFARLFDEAGVDALLVGDSLGNVIQGHSTTLPVSVEHIIYHTAAVARGTRHAHIIADMPFGSYGASLETSIHNAMRIMAEGGAHAVKLEGGAEQAELVARLVSIGIPVMGHLGLTPQSVHALGGFHVQGRGADAERLKADALALQEAGAYAIVLEMVPRQLANEVTASLRIPTIGIGAGNGTSGQVLVCYDLLGLNDNFKPRFLKHFSNLGQSTRDAIKTYIDEVKARTYPDDAHSFES